MRKKTGYLAFFLPLVLSACFGIDRSGGIMKYKAGTVYTGTGRFNVPKLPPPWRAPKIKLKQLVHENNDIRAMIVTDALCGPKYDDGPLPKLADELFQKMTDRKTLSQKGLVVAGRGAWRMVGQGRI